MPLALTSVSLAFAPHAAPIAPVAAPSWAMRAPTPELVVLPDPERSRTARRWKMYEAAPATPAKRSRASKVRIGAATAIATAAGIRALPGIGRFYSAASIAAPLSCAVTTAAVKGVASDLFAQIVVERKLNMRDISYSRTFAFASFGAVYLGALASVRDPEMPRADVCSTPCAAPPSLLLAPPHPSCELFIACAVEVQLPLHRSLRPEHRSLGDPLQGQPRHLHLGTTHLLSPLLYRQGERRTG